MKSISTLALGLALALGSAAAAVPAYAAGQEAAPARKFKFSKEAQPKLGEVQKALGAGDEAAYQTAFAAAQAAAQNADDRYALAQFQLQHAIKANSDTEKAAAIEALLASGGATEAELPALYQNLGALAFNAKQFDKAATAFKKVVELRPNDAAAKNNLAAALAQSNPNEAVSTLIQSLETAKASGQKPTEDAYKQALSLAYKGKMPQTLQISRDLIAAYPTAENWRDGLLIYREMNNLDTAATIDLLRLLRVTKAMGSERNYYDLADALNDRGLPGETKAVIEEGAAAGTIKLSDPAFKELHSLASGKVAEDKASLPGLEKAALSSAKGTQALSTGDAYFGYGEYAKAAALYKAAVEKGSVDANVANTRLGMALALAGQRAEAEAAFKAVSGPRKELANYWLIWLGQRG